MSFRFIQTLATFSPGVMPYSIDEAFLDLTGIESVVSYEDFGHQIKDVVRQWTGLPICVGVAPSPTLAKLANHGAKKYPATRGVVDLTDRDRQRRVVALEHRAQLDLDRGHGAAHRHGLDIGEPGRRDDDLPIGLARGTGDPTRTGRTCAICHVARLPDGRVWTGFPAVELRINQFAVDVDAAWVAAGNEPRLTPEDVERRSLLPQPGIDSVTGSDSPYLAPVDFPFYLNFGRRSLFGSDGNARDARSAILVSIFGFRGSDNPVPFPRDARTAPFVDFLMTLETPLPLEPPDATLVERGRAVFAEARCDSCHHPEDQAEERVVDWVESGPERLPGEDPDHPNGTIATDGERYQMTTFSGGVDESREAFAICIARNGLRAGPSDGYIPRDIHAAFASAPFLHNGSVPTLEDLLRPAAERPTTFMVRGVEVDTTVPGMSNAGHEFGTALPDADREALIAYLESL